MRLKLPLCPYCEPITLLDANFAHCCSTWLRGGSGEKHKIVQIAVFLIIFLTDCLKNLQKFEVRYFRVVHFESNWRHTFTHYVTIISVLINIGSQTSSLISWVRQTKISWSKFCTFFSLIEIWGRLTHFSVTELLSIYHYILNESVNRWNF